MSSKEVKLKYRRWRNATDAKKFDPNWPGPDNLYGYTGLGYDYHSGLTYARARYYNPEIGRFISEDTYEGDITNPLSLNLYTYVENNPLRFNDPTGHMKAETLNAMSVAYNQVPNTYISSYALSMAVFAENGIGGIWTAFHEIAQLNASKQIYDFCKCQAELEYSIKSKTEKDILGRYKYFEADIVLGRAVWEVKPYKESAEAQLNKYTSEADLVRGMKLNEMKVDIVKDYKMKIYSEGPGDIRYKFVKDNDDGSESGVSSWTVWWAIFGKLNQDVAAQFPCREDRVFFLPRVAEIVDNDWRVQPKAAPTIIIVQGAAKLK